MQNISIYVGFVLVSENEDGSKKVATTDGLAWHGLDDLQATMVQDILTNEFAGDMDANQQAIRERFVQLGYSVSSADSKAVDACRKLAK